MKASDAVPCQTCGRPRATRSDIDRWNRECGQNYRGPEPTWSREDGEQLICWTKLQFLCLNRPTRDLKYDRCRRSFIEFCKEHGL